jgi:hypothetical protein
MKIRAAVLLVMLGGRVVLAQDAVPSAQRIALNVAVANAAAPEKIILTSLNVAAAGDLGNAASWNRGESFASGGTVPDAARTEAGTAEVGTEAPAFAAPAPQKVDVTETDALRWQLAFGPSFVRFRSGVFNASAVGTYTSVSWSKSEWLSAEGQIVTGFAPVLTSNEHVKYVSYAGGIKLGSHKSLWEPFAHALIGGAHEQPQVFGASGRNSYMIEAGGGVDYRFWSRMSLRAEADYLRTAFFKSSQNNLQATLAAVFHF